MRNGSSVLQIGSKRPKIPWLRVYQIETVNRLNAGRAVISRSYSPELFIRLSHGAYSTCESDRHGRRGPLGPPYAEGVLRRTGLAPPVLVERGSERLSADRPVTGVATPGLRAAPALVGAVPRQPWAAVWHGGSSATSRRGVLTRAVPRSPDRWTSHPIRGSVSAGSPHRPSVLCSPSLPFSTP